MWVQVSAGLAVMVTPVDPSNWLPDMVFVQWPSDVVVGSTWDGKTFTPPAVMATPALPSLAALAGRVKTLEDTANPVASLTAAGGIKANIDRIARTTTPIAVAVPVLSAAVTSVSVVVAVVGVQVGDFVRASFAATPPVGMTIGPTQVIAQSSVLVTFQTTQAVTIAASTQSLQFCWIR